MVDLPMSHTEKSICRSAATPRAYGVVGNVFVVPRLDADTSTLRHSSFSPVGLIGERDFAAV
jgi:hypothetical protein